MSDRVMLPCGHGNWEGSHLLGDAQGRLLDGPGMVPGDPTTWLRCPGGRVVEIDELLQLLIEQGALEHVGTQMLWRCRNCGDDHGGAGCGNADLVDYHTYRIAAALGVSDE